MQKFILVYMQVVNNTNKILSIKIRGFMNICKQVYMINLDKLWLICDY